MAQRAELAMQSLLLFALQKLRSKHQVNLDYVFLPNPIQYSKQQSLYRTLDSVLSFTKVTKIINTSHIPPLKIWFLGSDFSIYQIHATHCFDDSILRDQNKKHQYYMIYYVLLVNISHQCNTIGLSQEIKVKINQCQMDKPQNYNQVSWVNIF